MKRFTIGKLAKAANIGVETIRYYERRGLITQPPKQEFGYRHYPETTLRRIHFIKNVQTLGLTLSEIDSVLDLLDGKRMNCATAADMVQSKISEVDQKIEALKQLKQLLERLSRHIGSCGDKGEIWMGTKEGGRDESNKNDLAAYPERTVPPLAKNPLPAHHRA